MCIVNVFKVDNVGLTGVGDAKRVGDCYKCVQS